MPIYQLEDFVPQLDEGAWVAPNATVIGDVHLETNANVWWNAVIRGDRDRIVIGANSNIQDGSVLHTDPGLHLIVGAEVTVGHMVMMHGCTIGDNSLIGIGSILLNRSVIGRNSMVGAGTLIPEGKIFPEGVLILGRPGKVVRELTEEEIRRLGITAANYVSNAQRYARSAKAIQLP